MESNKPQIAQQLVFDYRLAELDVSDRSLCDYAVKLTLAPATVTDSDVLRLRDHGFSDEQITVAIQVIGYFNYINRVAEGCGVDPEDWMTPTADEWRRRKASDWQVRD